MRRKPRIISGDFIYRYLLDTVSRVYALLGLERCFGVLICDAFIVDWTVPEIRQEPVSSIEFIDFFHHVLSPIPINNL